MMSGKGDPDFEGDADGNIEGDAEGLATVCGALTWTERQKQTVPAPMSIAQN